MALWAGPHLKSQQPQTVEDMYKVVSRIVLALKSPSGLRVEIRGKGAAAIGGGRWGRVKEMGPAPHWGDEDVEKVTPVLSYSLPFLWKGSGRGSQCEVPRRLLLSRDFHILIWGWLSSMGQGASQALGV